MDDNIYAVYYGGCVFIEASSEVEAIEKFYSYDHNELDIEIQDVQRNQ